MGKKSARVAALLDGIEAGKLPVEYAGFFACFNQGWYYEAHDVLESLWLKDRQGPDGDFYKGLIQLAGAFVHLQKNRLGPAAALFKLAGANLGKYPQVHHGLVRAELLGFIEDWVESLRTRPDRNPLDHEPPPQISPG